MSKNLCFKTLTMTSKNFNAMCSSLSTNTYQRCANGDIGTSRPPIFSKLQESWSESATLQENSHSIFCDLFCFSNSWWSNGHNAYANGKCLGTPMTSTYTTRYEPAQNFNHKHICLCVCIYKATHGQRITELNNCLFLKPFLVNLFTNASAFQFFLARSPWKEKLSSSLIAISKAILYQNWLCIPVPQFIRTPLACIYIYIYIYIYLFIYIYMYTCVYI